jgi:hypothetical protein
LYALINLIFIYMKKVILALSGLLILALVVVLFTNAQNSQKEVKKSTTEMSKSCSKCPFASSGMTAEVKTADAAKCDPARCKAMGCDPAKCKEGKCDPATCKANCDKAKGEPKKCCPAMGKETASK